MNKPSDILNIMYVCRKIMGRDFFKYHHPQPAHYTTIENTNWIEQAVDRMWGKYK